MRLRSLSKKDRSAYVAVEVSLIEVGSSIDQVGFITQRGAAEYMSAPFNFQWLNRDIRILVDKNLYLAGFGDLQGGVNQKWNLFQVAHARPAKDGFRSNLVVDLIN